MILKTALNLDRYHWMNGGLTADDDAVVTVDITAPDRPCSIAVQFIVSSAMLSIRPTTKPRGKPTPDGLVVDLGPCQPGEHRRLRARFFPRPASRPGRRRVTVVRVLVDGEVVESTTVWARVERSR